MGNYHLMKLSLFLQQWMRSSLGNCYLRKIFIQNILYGRFILVQVRQICAVHIKQTNLTISVNEFVFGRKNASIFHSPLCGFRSLHDTDSVDRSILT